jgi:hypothetical protein
MPVCVFVAVIVTPGINAPVESETVPPTLALNWLNAWVQKPPPKMRVAANAICLIAPPELWFVLLSEAK